MKIKTDLLKGLEKILPDVKMTERSVVYLSLILLFVISATYLNWFGKGLFFYQENKSLFIFSVEYLQKFTSKPGGLLDYAGNFLTQGFVSSFYGALAISILLMIVCLVFKQINQQLNPSGPFSLLFILVPACILLVLHTRYDFYIKHSLGFIMVSLWFLVSIVPAKRYIRFVILVLFPLFYYLVGSFAWIYLGMFIMFSIIYEKKPLSYLLPLILISNAFLSFLLFKEVLFLQPLDHLLRYPLFFNDTSRLTMFLYLFSAFLILYPVYIKISGKISLNRILARVFYLSVILSLFPLTVLLLLKNNDPELDKVMQMEKSVYREDWDEVIKQHEKFPSTNIIGQYYYNLALSGKGQLCDRLFFGQQNFGPMSLTLPRDGEQSARAAYYYYSIGLTGEAHHLAYEMMVQHGYTPENIKMLIKTELIDGNYKLAERYINVLKKTIHYRGWAEKYEKLLLNPVLINTDPDLGEKIRMLPKSDFFIVPDDVKNIDLFLQINPDNKRAFEYKIARLLLEKDMLAVVDEVKKMKDIGYSNIPRHIEEVVVAYKNLSKEVPDLDGLSVSPETEQRFLQYRTVYAANKGNKSLIEKKLKKAEKNTFWYYLQFGIVNSDFLERNPESSNIY
jgi:hypothetical protein